MLNYYQCIKLIPDEECPVYFLRNTCFTKLHKALSTLKSTDIGVSFPNYKVKLGDIIRLHGSKERLTELQESNWLGGLSGCCELTNILPIPENIEGYRTLSRKQPTMTLKKLEKRIAYQKENGTLQTDEDINNYERQYKAKMFATGLDNPYLELQSASNGNMHRRYIVFGKLQNNSIAGEFDQFGLSKIATIPWF